MIPTKEIFDTKTGRPPVYESPKDMQMQVNEYFETLTEDENPTITGLTLFLGFESRQSFYDYERKEEFSYTIKRSRLAIEHIYEQRLQESSATGAIFALKNMGWRDRDDEDNLAVEKLAKAIQSLRDGEDGYSSPDS